MHKKWVKNKKAVTFDMDGTLLQSNGVWDAAYNTVASALGGDFVPVRKVGQSVKDDWYEFLGKYGDKVKLSAAELTEHTHSEFLKQMDKIEITEGFWDLSYVIKADFGLKIGLVTNSDRVVVDRVIAHFQLEKLFDIVVCGNEVKKRKPHPEIYRTAAKKLGVLPKEILAFEDSVAGTFSARLSGCSVAVVWDGSVGQSNYPDGVLEFIPDFTDLGESLKTTFQEDLKLAAQELEEIQKERKE